MIDKIGCISTYIDMIQIEIDRRIDGQIGGWMNRKMDKWMDIYLDRLLDIQIGRQIDRYRKAIINMYICIEDRYTDTLKDGQICKYIHRQILIQIFRADRVDLYNLVQFG